MAYRLAIAISGAVSLGSYEAGVMFEIIRAIGAHNNENANDPNNQIKIDVLTGASAGGMTAAILAQKLLFEAEALEDPYENQLYQPWVKMADVMGMLETQPGEDPNKSILSSAFIADIAKKFLLDRYSNSAPSSVRHAAAGDTIHLGLAMSNLNGVDYSIPVFNGTELSDPTSKFTYTRFQDRMTLEVGKENDKQAFWDNIATAARSCGAFPFAFRALQVDRKKTDADYNSPNLHWNTAVKHPFLYTDGGVFNNSPLGMAKLLAERQDTRPRDYEKRYYLYISPDRKPSTANISIDKDNATMLNTGKAILNSIFQQGRFQDWVTAAHYNEVIQQFDDRADNLCELLRHIDDTERAGMATVADNLLKHLYSHDTDNTPSREDDYIRLREQFISDDDAQSLLTEKGEPAVDTWLQSVQVLEKSGRLGQKDKMQVYTITASEDELAGEGMVAFAGFFDIDFRKFDYNAGRKKAREFLTNLKNMSNNSGNDNYLPLTDFELPDDVQDLNRDLANATLADVDRNVREALNKRLYKRTGQLLKQFKLSSLIRGPLMYFFIKKKLRALLKLN